jgi:Fe-S-cluster-containing hydrogenase component 2
VNVPKLKTHGLTRYTGAIKNMFGSIPANGKKNVHLLAPKNRSMAQALVDVFEMVQPHITIMDAVIGMEGNGPNAGDPRKVGLIIAGIDGVALDAVVSTIIGFDPMKVPIIKYAHERKLGTADMNKIDVSGEDICKVAVSDFKKPSSSAQDFASNYIPDFLLAKMFDNSCSSVSSVYEPNCTRCYECIRNCPAKAMSAPDGRVIVDEDKCIGCFCCDEVCNYKAIVMKRTFLGRAFLKMAVFLGVERLQ